MRILPENLHYRNWIVLGLGVWSGLMILFALVTGLTNFGLGDSGLHIVEKLYAIAAIVVAMHLSARFNTTKKVRIKKTD